MTIDIEYEGTQFEVSGEYNRGYSETEYDPACDAFIDEFTIKHKDDDLTDLLSTETYKAIYEKTLLLCKD